MIFFYLTLAMSSGLPTVVIRARSLLPRVFIEFVVVSVHCVLNIFVRFILFFILLDVVANGISAATVRISCEKKYVLNNHGLENV